MPHLQFTAGGRTLFAHPLRPGRTVIGRSDTCDLALPGDDLSRVHLVVERRDDGWWVVDRSRHGTLLNGERLDRAPLVDGDTLRIGPYTARFWLDGDDATRRPTATGPMWAGEPDELVEVGADGFATAHAVVRLVDGPREGEQVRLRRSRVSVGGRGADVVIDEALPHDALFLRVVRGRVTAEPGTVVARLAGSSVREPTPVLPGEELYVGGRGLLVTLETTHEQRSRDRFGEMVGASPAMRALFGTLSKVARSDALVLLVGESGTGKELAARALHSEGLRVDGPFVAVNCAAISANLFESELFGHEKGAFTGADAARDGAFQRAAGGVLFLDEVGELTLDAQAKLLRALESGEVQRVGATQVTRPDVRVVAATNRDLPTMVAQGTFRRDLYHRLSILVIRLPALRERGQDVELVARAILDRHHQGAAITPEAVAQLLDYGWPGNVRELRNVLTRAVVLGGVPIQPEHLTFNPTAFGAAAPGEPPVADEPPLLAMPSARAIADLERLQVREAMDRAGGNRSQAARLLGIPRSSLLYKLRRLGLD